MLDLFTKPFAGWTLIDVGMLLVWLVGAWLLAVIASALSE
jgi:hypothetical protein